MFCTDMFSQLPCVSQEEKECTKALREIEDKLIHAAVFKLVSFCFTLYFNDCCNKIFLTYFLDITHSPVFCQNSISETQLYLHPQVRSLRRGGGAQLIRLIPVSRSQIKFRTLHFYRNPKPSADVKVKT
jgi:hypothetical protein